MSTTNTMPAVVQTSVQTKVQVSKPVTKTGRKTDASENSFDEALGKATTDAKQSAADVAADSQDGAADTGAREDKQQNPLAVVLAALQQENSNSVAAQTENVQSQSGTEPAAVLSISDRAKGQFVNTAQTETVMQSNLQSLIPQSAEAGMKNQDFLAMLSGQQLKPAGSQTLAAGMQIQSQAQVQAQAQNPAQSILQNAGLPTTSLSGAASVQILGQQAAAGTVLEAQLANSQTVAGNLQGMMVQQSQNTATAVNQPMINQTLSPAAISSQAAAPETAAKGAPATQAVSPAAISSQAAAPETAAQGAPVMQTVSPAAMSGQAAAPETAAQGAPVTQTVSPAAMSGQAAIAQPAAPTTAAAQTVSPVTVTDQAAMAQPVIRQVEDSGNTKSASSLLEGAPLSVEDRTQAVPLRMDAQQAMGQHTSSGQQNAAGQNPGQPGTDDAGSQWMQQLPEEAAADRTAPATQKTTDTTASNQVSMFQQGLQDSIKGTGTVNQTQTAQQTQTDYDIPRQIVDQARLIRTNENTEMVIKLNPEHLGDLTLKVSVSQNGSVNASFHSDNAQVRTIIENSLVQLRQELNNQGIKVDSVEVYAGLADGQLPQNQGQQAGQNQQRSSNTAVRGVQMGSDDYVEEAESLSAAVQNRENTAMEGVDYRI